MSHSDTLFCPDVHGMYQRTCRDDGRYSFQLRPSGLKHMERTTRWTIRDESGQRTSTSRQPTLRISLGGRVSVTMYYISADGDERQFMIDLTACKEGNRLPVLIPASNDMLTEAM